MVRKLLGLLLGLLAGLIAVMMVEVFAATIYGSSELPDLQDREGLQQYMEQLPVGALLMVLLAHALGALVAGAVCCWVQGYGWRAGTAALGTLFLVAGAINLWMVPHPWWFMVVDLVLYIPCAMLPTLLFGTHPKSAARFGR